MNKKEILKMVDHTLLSQTAVWNEIQELCEEAILYETASVCIPPVFVKRAKEYVKDNMKICTVIGFPNGYMTKEAKIFETKDALKNGADEIDMVIHIGNLKAGKYDEILKEIKEIKESCGNHILKVIIETCLLTENEKVKMCEIVTKAGADYIKTSTGFSKAGATFEDVKIFRKYVGEAVRIKAAGGISSFEDAEKFIELGAERLGTSRLIKLIKTEMGES